MFQKRKERHRRLTQQTLSMRLLDVEQDLRLNDSLVNIKRSFSSCSEMLYESEHLFQQSPIGYTLVKRIFSCYSFAFSRLFETVEKLQPRSKLGDNKGSTTEHIEQTDQAETSEQNTCFLDGKSLGGVSVDSRMRGVQQPVEESTPSVVADFQKMRLMSLPKDEAEEVTISLNKDQIKHLKLNQVSMSTSNFINHIGAHLNTVRAKLEPKCGKKIRQEISVLLEEFQAYQKDVTHFINKQALEVPIFCSADFNVLIDEFQEQRSRWCSSAVQRLSQFISALKSKILRIFSLIQQQIEKPQHPSAESCPSSPVMSQKQWHHRQVQTIQAQEQHTLMQCFGEQSVELQTMRQHNHQLEQSLYVVQRELDTCRIENINIRERADLTKQQLARLRVQLDDLQVRVIGEHAEKQELRMRLERASKMDIGRMVEEFAEQYSIEMRLGIRDTVEKVLREVGVLEEEIVKKQQSTEDNQEVKTPKKQSLKKVMGKKLSNRSFDSFQGFHRSIIEQLGELKRTQEEVLKNLEQPVQQAPSECSNDTSVVNYSTGGPRIQGLVIKQQESESASDNELDDLPKKIHKRKDTINSSTSSVDHRDSKRESGKRTPVEKKLSTISKYASKRNSAFVTIKPHQQLKSSQQRYSLSNTKRQVREVPIIHKQISQTSKVFKKSVDKINPSKRTYQPSERVPSNVSVPIRTSNTVSTNTQPTVSIAHEYTQTDFPVLDVQNLFKQPPKPFNFRRRTQDPIRFYNSINKMAEIQNQQTKPSGNNLTDDVLLSPQPSQRFLTANPASLDCTVNLQKHHSTQQLSSLNDEKLESALNTPAQAEENIRSNTHHVCRQSKTSEKDRYGTGVKPCSSTLSSRGSKHFSNKKSELIEYTAALLKESLFSELKDSGQLRQELLELVQSNRSGFKLPSRFSRSLIADLIHQATLSHQATCGKRICRHLLRFLERLKTMVDGKKQFRRKPLGVKLHNIMEIPITSAPTIKAHATQPYFYF